MKNEILPFSVFENLEEIDIDIKNAEDTVKKLNKLLSNHFILFMKLWNFHWIVVSKRFKNIHEFFNELYDKFFENIDTVAERIRSLGGKPFGTFSEYIEESDIKEYDKSNVPDANKMIEIILEDYETLIKKIRKYLEDGELDNGTNKLLEDLIEEYEKNAWMLRSNIEK
jgi:starvation-inducible DNA-binding protein